MNVWSAGCAGGEEVYSLKMLITWMGERGFNLPGIRILGTDINGHSLKRANEGVYTASSLQKVSQDFKTRYFHHIKKGNLYIIKDFLKTDITWQIHNIFSASPGGNFSLVLARNNLLTYYSHTKQEEGLKQIISAIRPEGFLIIGEKEELPEKFKKVFINKYYPSVFHLR